MEEIPVPGIELRGIKPKNVGFGVYSTIFFLRNLVNSMGNNDSLMNRKSWKISINCYENDTIFKSFSVEMILELFGFFILFYVHCND